MAIHDALMREDDGHDRRFEFLPAGPLGAGISEIICLPPQRWTSRLSASRIGVPAVLERARGWWRDEDRRRAARELADLAGRSLAYLGLILGLLLAVNGLALAG